jgi:hypothetical protein
VLGLAGPVTSQPISTGEATVRSGGPPDGSRIDPWMDTRSANCQCVDCQCVNCCCGEQPKSDDSPPPGLLAQIEGPATVESGGFAVTFKIPAGSVPRWHNDLPKEPDLKVLDEAGNKVWIWFQPVAGNYEFHLYTQIPQDGLDPFAEDFHTIKVGKQEEKKEEEKKEEVEPKPVDGKVWALIVEESENRSPIVAALVANDDLRDDLATKQVHVRFYDETMPEAASYVSALRHRAVIGAGLLIIDEKRNVLHAGPVPEDLGKLIKEQLGR